MSFLSEALRQYYHHVSNRIFFKDGVTLNQLAILMWEKLGYREIDASVLSRVINGVRLFTKRQLSVFCKIMNLKYDEIAVLQNALIKDVLARSGNQSIISPFFSSEKEIINIVASLIKSGKPTYAIELASFFENYVTRKDLLAQLCNEKSRAYGLISSPSKVLFLMTPLNNKAQQLGEELRDRKILAKTWMNIGGVFMLGPNGGLPLISLKVN